MFEDEIIEISLIHSLVQTSVSGERDNNSL